MPNSALHQQLQALRDELNTAPPVDAEERAELFALLQDIEQQLLDQAINQDSLVDDVNLAIERFEVSHPTLAGTLRSVLQSLANMGI